MAITQEKTAVIKMTAAADAITGMISVAYLHWHSKAAVAGNDLVVSDTAGNVLWEDSANGARYKNYCHLNNRVNGIVVTTMTTGELYVYKPRERS